MTVEELVAILKSFPASAEVEFPSGFLVGGARMSYGCVVLQHKKPEELPSTISGYTDDYALVD